MEGHEIILDLGLPQTLKELGIAFYKGHERRSYFEMSASMDSRGHLPLIPRSESAGKTTAIQRFGCGLGMIDPTGDGSGVAEYSNKGLFGLFTDVPPSENFDLSAWKITVPYDKDSDGKVYEIKEDALGAGWQDTEVFYTDPVTGGMVFRTIPGGVTTQHSSYARSELRQMMRADNTDIKTRNDDGTPTKNNWVLSTAPADAQALAGGVDGVLRATLAVNQVTRTGEQGKIGRVIIGQVHTKDDEPIRLYYRKLPGNKFGSVYCAHEALGQDDVWVAMIRTRKDNAGNPADGIALDEICSYEIAVSSKLIDGTLHPMLDFKIIRDDGTEIAAPSFDMAQSGYNVADDFMYFKAGAYSQNNSILPEWRGADQVTFYKLETAH